MSLILLENPENNDPQFQPVTLTPKQRYNLRNQSWGIPRRNKDNILADPLETYKDALNNYPSNSEVVWTGLQFQPVESGADPYERLFPNLYKDKLGAEAVAAKGYFIIDVLRRGQSRIEAYDANNNRYAELQRPTITLPADLSPGGAKYVAQYAGRVWYSGFSGEVIDGDLRSPTLSNYVLFTQLIKNRKDFVKCYQEGDPTSRETNEIVDTDGGFIKLSGAENIIGMVSLAAYLIVIAENGVWAISGGSDYGFTATNYKAEKISSFGGIGTYSIIQDGARAFFWGEDGIYVIAPNEAGVLSVVNITEKTIQKLFQAIPNTAKREASATYDQQNKTIRWIYKLGAGFNSSSQTYELILNTVLGAFSQYRIYNDPSNTHEIVYSFSAPAFTTTTLEEIVVVGTQSVVVGIDTVVVPSSVNLSIPQSTRYLVATADAGMIKISFGFYRNTTFRDWNSVDAYGSLLTGDITGGDSSVTKQTPYLTFHMERTENGVASDGTPANQSGCLVRSQWDFAVGSASNKWSPAFQVYRYNKPRLVEGPDDNFDTGFKLITTKNKMRGRGRAFSMHIQTEPGKDCRIVGWSLAVNGNEAP